MVAMPKQISTLKTNQGAYTQYLKKIAYRLMFSSCWCLSFVSVMDIYLKIVTNKLANDTRIEVALTHNDVLCPMSEFLALVLLGLT